MRRLVVTMALVLAGCNWPLNSDYATDVGYVWKVDLPDTVEAGKAFQVTIWTSASDGRWIQAGDEVRSGESGVLIIPRDRYKPNGSGATVVVDLKHVVTLRPSKPGALSIYVRTADVEDGHTVFRTLPRSVYVKPSPLPFTVPG